VGGPGEALARAEALARRHYENFPVAPWWLPARLRRPLALIYAFARTADDLADEGPAPPEARREALRAYRAALDRALEGRTAGEPEADPLLLALAEAVRTHGLPPQALHDLLSAFEQDTWKRRYATYAEVADYCRRSAQPVGRLVLHLAGAADPEALRRSDAVCTGLQLVNFLQDLAQDLEENDRIYLPRDEMAACGVSEEDLRRRRVHPGLRRLLALQRKRARGLLLQGRGLGRRVGGRLGLQLALTVEGGLRVLELLETAADPFARPRLRRRDLPLLLARLLGGRALQAGPAL